MVFTNSRPLSYYDRDQWTSSGDIFGQDASKRHGQNLKILQCEPGWTLEQVKTQFIKLTKRYHPDAPGGSTERFILIREAYEEIESRYLEKERLAREAAQSAFGRDGAEMTAEELKAHVEKTQKEKEELRQYKE